MLDQDSSTRSLRVAIPAPARGPHHGRRSIGQAAFVQYTMRRPRAERPPASRRVRGRSQSHREEAIDRRDVRTVPPASTKVILGMGQPTRSAAMTAGTYCTPCRMIQQTSEHGPDAHCDSWRNVSHTCRSPRPWPRMETSTGPGHAPPPGDSTGSSSCGPMSDMTASAASLNCNTILRCLILCAMLLDADIDGRPPVFPP